MARVICAAGANADDIVQIAFGYGLFTGGFGLHYGMEKIGAMVVPLSSGNTERQIMLMQDFGSTVLIATPSYALYLAEEMAKRGIDKDTIKLRLALFGGEGHTEEMRAKIESQLGILATENYGLSEVGGPRRRRWNIPSGSPKATTPPTASAAVPARKNVLSTCLSYRR